MTQQRAFRLNPPFTIGPSRHLVGDGGSGAVARAGVDAASGAGESPRQSSLSRNRTFWQGARSCRVFWRVVPGWATHRRAMPNRVEPYPVRESGGLDLLDRPEIEGLARRVFADAQRAVIDKMIGGDRQIIRRWNAFEYAAR
jgi:hypothetical protein